MKLGWDAVGRLLDALGTLLWGRHHLLKRRVATTSLTWALSNIKKYLDAWDASAEKEARES